MRQATDTVQRGRGTRLKAAPATRNTVPKVDNIDFSGFVEFTHTYNAHCECEDICRCKTIESSEVDYTYFNYPLMARQLIGKNSLASPIQLYGCERILRNRLHAVEQTLTADDLAIYTVPDYYGDSIGSAELVGDEHVQITNDLKDFWKQKTAGQQVAWLLNYEYGKTLPILKNRQWKVQRVPVQDIYMPNDGHVQTDIVHDYQAQIGHPQVPSGIVRSNGQKYHLVDGYHRVSAAKAQGKYDLLMVVAV